MTETEQIDVWSGDFGKDYTDRNPATLDDLNELYRRYFGVTRTDLNEAFLGSLDRSMPILEVGANVGVQLQALHTMGFEALHALELQEYAIDIGKMKLPQVDWVQGNAFDIPFPDGCVDLAFTSGVLIHISPDDISGALDEIHRCSRKYIWGFEYFADRYTEIQYRGHAGLMWKTNFSSLYLERFDDLELVQERRLPHLESEDVDTMFLLRKV